MKGYWQPVLAWLLCLALLSGLSAAAFAQSIPINAIDAAAVTEPPVTSTVASSETPSAPVLFPESSILDSAALTRLVEDFLQQKGIPKDRVGVGFCYTATGDEWFYNPDTWFYPGSMYKVPLMMLLSEKIKSGDVSPDEQIGGLDLNSLYEYILVYSNNDYAHKVRTYLGGDSVWRKDAQKYAALDSYDERYMLYCYFSPRYMTRVMETLHENPERFPGVEENLLKAENGHYFQYTDEMKSLDIAQKYGAYLDNEGSDWNHTTGIIFTPNPIILTIMTKNVGGPESFIGQLAVLFKNYALETDEKLTAYREEQVRLQEELKAAEEAERLAEEQAAVQTAESPKPAAQKRPSQPETLTQSITPDRAERGHRAGIIVLSLLLAAAVIGGVGAVVIVKERERRRYESYKRRFEAELRQEAMEQEQQRSRAAQTIERVREEAPAKPADSARAAARNAAPRRETQRIRHTQIPPAEHLRRRRAAEQEQPEWNDEDEE